MPVRVRAVSLCHNVKRFTITNEINAQRLTFMQHSDMRLLWPDLERKTRSTQRHTWADASTRICGAAWKRRRWQTVDLSQTSSVKRLKRTSVRSPAGGRANRAKQIEWSHAQSHRANPTCCPGAMSPGLPPGSCPDESASSAARKTCPCVPSLPGASETGCGTGSGPPAMGL